MKENKEFSYFDVLTSIINKKQIDDQSIDKHFSPFQAIRWLSNNPIACYESNKINIYSKIPKSAEYRFLKNSIKLKKNTRLPFDKKDKDLKIIIKTICKEYKIGPETAKEYIKILPSKITLEILNKWAMTNNNYIKDKEVIELRKAIENKKIEIEKGNIDERSSISL